jgi:hypothetical protein
MIKKKQDQQKSRKLKLKKKSLKDLRPAEEKVKGGRPGISQHTC